MENETSNFRRENNVFKPILISKIVHLALVTPISTDIINHLNTTQKHFLWKSKYSKVKHETLRKMMNKVVWRVLIFFSKFLSFQCSWTQKLYDKNFHEWEIILFNLLNNNLGKKLNFHSNLLIKSSLTQNLPCYYQKIFSNWYKHLSFPVSITSTIMSQFLWVNKYILIEKQSLFFPTVWNNGLNFVGQFFYNNGEIKD